MVYLCVCVCVCVLYLEAQCSSDQCVCRLDAVRLSVLGAVAVWESLQTETRKEIHRCGGVHQRAAGRDAHHLVDIRSHTHRLQHCNYREQVYRENTVLVNSYSNLVL